MSSLRVLGLQLGVVKVTVKLNYRYTDNFVVELKLDELDLQMLKA